MDDWVVFVLGVIFIVVVLPYWLKLHYGEKKNKKQVDKKTNDSEKVELEGLSDLANDLAVRVKNLEAILDAETPDWRKKYE